MQQEMTCEHCRYWSEGESNRKDCRRHSPELATTIGDNHANWPSTKKDEWCGDYRPNLRERSIRSSRIVGFC